MKNQTKNKIAILLALITTSNVYANDILGSDKLVPTERNKLLSQRVVSTQTGGDGSNSETKNVIVTEEVVSKATINQSKVFGEWIFNGNFAQNNLQGFNQNYKISIGDNILIKLWGVIQHEFKATVDKQGNIFVPEIGPIHVLGLENSKINSLVGSYIKKVYKSNVNFYVTLDNEQPVKVYISGFAKQPGLYSGLSSDSILYYIDKAGGIDPSRGSFLDVSILRDGEVKDTINLYDFLFNAKMKMVQFKDGDIIQITPKKSKVHVQGNVRNSFEFEFGKHFTLKDLISYAQPETTVNKVHITRKNNNDIKTLSYDINLTENGNNNLAELDKVVIQNDDKVSFFTDKKINTVSIQMVGEHDSIKDIIMPVGSTINDAIQQLQLNDRTDIASIQLYRESVRRKQKESILESIRMLEGNLLSLTSSTKNMADLRDKEANMVMKLIESAKKVEPKGQVILENSSNLSQVYLEEGDVLRIPAKNWLVTVSGQVIQPTSLVWNDDYSLEDYIENAGGYLNNADSGKILIRRPSGAILVYNNGLFSTFGKNTINKGDEIIILPKAEVKNIQMAKDIGELIYQIAVGAAVILKL